MSIVNVCHLIAILCSLVSIGFSIYTYRVSRRERQ